MSMLLLLSGRRRRVSAVGSAQGSSTVIGVSGVEAVGQVGEVVSVVDSAQAELTGHAPTVIVSWPEALVGATLVGRGDKTEDGDVIIAVTPIFKRFLRELQRDPNALYHLNPRQFEELIAGAYEEEGCDEVILTPRSGDKGRDVIATSKKFGVIRIIEQVKLFAPDRVVDADDVSALHGVLTRDLRASKGIITTSSRFAPGVPKLLEQYTPSRISLIDGEMLRDRLALIRNE